METLPAPEVIRAVIQRFGGLVSELGDELGERPLVLPTSQYFPDEFKPNAKGARRLLKRMQLHAGLSDVPIELELIGDEPEQAGGSCGTSSCGSGGCAPPQDEQLERLVPHGDGWRLRMLAGELNHPVQLTTALALALGHVFLFETAEAGSTPTDLNINAEFAAVGLGFGVLLMEGSYVYSKSCGGPQVTSLTKLGCGELAIATTLFSKLRGHKLRGALAELSTTQRAALKEAQGVIDSNPRVLELLSQAPEALMRGEFQLSDAKPWLVRLFGARSKPDAIPETIEEMEALASRMSGGALGDAAEKRSAAEKRGAGGASSAEQQRKAELRALVEAALSDDADLDDAALDASAGSRGSGDLSADAE